ncbi:unnamed protein product [Prunus armeniaca]
MERAAGSVVHPPYFGGYNYGAWKAKMKSFLWPLDERVWNTVVHGFFEPTKITGKGDEERTLPKPREEWTNAEVTHEGTDIVKGAKLQLYNLQFETLVMDDNEMFYEFYAKLCVIVNVCSNLGIEEIRDLNTLKVQELIGSIQTYEMKHLAPKKSKSVAFKVVNEEDDGHLNEDCSDEELTILTRRFMNFLKNQDPRSRDSKGNGRISSECANTLKKQNDGMNKAMHTTWSDSDSDTENNEMAIALITTVNLDEASKKNDDEGLDIDFVLEKYDDLLAASQKLSKQNAELVKTVAVLKLDKSRTANELPSSDTAPRMVKMAMHDETVAPFEHLKFDTLIFSICLSFSHDKTKFLKDFNG